MKIGIIGAGKVGISLASVLKKKGYEVTAISDMQPSSLELARRYLGHDTLYTENNLSVIEASEMIAITTQDRAIQEVRSEINSKAGSLDGKLFFHTSGADPSSVLEPLNMKGALLGSLHPLQTFPDIESAITVLPETCIFIEGNPQAIPSLRSIGESIGAKVFVIDSKDKVRYHLCAVFVCNLLAALLYTGKELMDSISVDFEPFLPIIRATIRNIENKGPLESLTGPVVRGDDKTVRAHLHSIDDMELHTRVYKALSEVALEMAKKRGTINGRQSEVLQEVIKGK